MSNHQQRGLKELFSRGVPLHAVDLARDPLDVAGVRPQFREARDGEDMIKRVVDPEHDQFSGIGATIALLFQFLANQLRVLGGLQAVDRGFLKVAAFTKRVAAVFHRGQAGSFTATVTHSRVSHSLLPSGCSLLDIYSALRAMGKVTVFKLAATGTKTFGLQSMIAFLALLVSMRFRGGVLISSSISTAPYPMISVSFLSFGYNRFSHAVHSLSVKGVVRLVQVFKHLSESLTLPLNVSVYQPLG